MRFSSLPPSIRTLVSRKPSTIGLRTNAAGAQTVLYFGSSSTLKVIAVSFQGFIAAIWQTPVRSRSALLRLLFEANVSKTVSTLGPSSSAGCCSRASLIRMSSPLLATCRSIQHALRLWVAIVSVVVCILHGPSSHPTRTVPSRVVALCFLTDGLSMPRGYALFACRGSWVGDGGSQQAARVSQALSIAQYFCTMLGKSTHFSMRRRLMALRIPLSAQFL